MTKDFGLTIIIFLLSTVSFGQKKDTVDMLLPRPYPEHEHKKIVGTFQRNKPNKTLADKSFNKGDIVEIPKIRFYTNDSIHFNDSAYNAITKFLKSHKNLVVEIICHTDTTGNPSDNLILSTTRAEYVKAELVDRFKVAQTQIKSKGYGGTKPITGIKEWSENGMVQRNMRTELKILQVK